MRTLNRYIDPHMAACGMISRFDLPGDNPAVAVVGSAIRFHDDPIALYRRPPRLGEHNAEVLREYGMDDGGKSDACLV